VPTTQFHPVSYLFLLPLIPLLGAFINGTMGLRLQRSLGKWAVHTIAVSASGATFAVALVAFFELAGGGVPLRQVLWDWFTLNGAGAKLDVPMAFTVDQLTAVMLLVVTGVGSLIHVFSIGYMHDEGPYWRYFAWLNLFMAMMLILVIGENMLLMFVGWEGVGLTSYLLIGYYYEDLDKAAAGMKAFIVNRVGDFAFVAGMAMLFWGLGGTYLDLPATHSYRVTDAGAFTLSFAQMSAAFSDPVFVEAFVAKTLFGIKIVHLVPVLLFIGACGKSAQIPLYVWLPDAMAGPTPVSALIHAATMVTAGVYMVVRMSFIFSLSDVAMTVVATTGAVTALFAATIGFFQTDIKKVLAYSTVSQLGYMFLAAGVGAYGAAIFHLMTHAFFKACLFLCSGAVIAAMHHRQDVKDLGGLRKVLPFTFWTFVVSTAAITGLPGMSGFFSKDEILWRTYDNANTIIPGELLWILGFVAALCTAFYMVRLLMLTFFGECRADEHTLSHAKEHWVMSVPLVTLAFLAIVGGFVGLPAWTHLPNLFTGWLDPVIGVADGRMQWASEMIHDGHAEEAGFALFHSHVGEIVLMVTTVGLAAVSAFMAFRIYRNYRSPEEEAALFGPKVHRLLVNKYFVDDLYQRFIIGPAMAAFRGVMWLDKWIVDGLVNLSAFFMKIAAWISGSLDFRIVDGTVNGVAGVTQAAARRVRRLQTGRIQQYVMGIVAGATVLVLVVYLF
jgi:NADH-quinone oxidoreductase subunit L